MEFDYVIEGSIFISDDDLDDMAKQVKDGRPIELVVDEYIACFDDYDYYHSFAYENDIINEVRKRAAS